LFVCLCAREKKIKKKKKEMKHSKPRVSYRYNPTKSRENPVGLSRYLKDATPDLCDKEGHSFYRIDSLPKDVRGQLLIAPSAFNYLAFHNIPRRNKGVLLAPSISKLAELRTGTTMQWYPVGDTTVSGQAEERKKLFSPDSSASPIKVKLLHLQASHRSKFVLLNVRMP
jgi:hypothetical protein